MCLFNDKYQEFTHSLQKYICNISAAVLSFQPKRAVFWNYDCVAKLPREGQTGKKKCVRAMLVSLLDLLGIIYFFFANILQS